MSLSVFVFIETLEYLRYSARIQLDFFKINFGDTLFQIIVHFIEIYCVVLNISLIGWVAEASASLNGELMAMTVLSQCLVELNVG